MKKYFVLFGFLFSIMLFSSVEANEAAGTYTVQKKDTLFGIAFRYNLSVKELVEINQLNRDELKVGQQLKISEIKRLKGKKIIIDPGHGGIETGAVNNEVIEKNETLDVSLKVKRQLEAEGAQVVLTIDEDFQSFRTLPLSERAGVAYQADADLFVSIHFNSNGSTSVHGTETYYNETEYKGTSNPYPKKSKELAESMQYHVSTEGKTKDLGVKENVFHVLRNNSVPSVLLEIGFVTNKEEAQRIKTDEFKEKVAHGISNGIIEYVR